MFMLTDVVNIMQINPHIVNFTQDPIEKKKKSNLILLIRYKP